MSSTEQPLSQDRLKRLLSYDPLTGVFSWLEARGGGQAGAEAGAITSNGHIVVFIDRKPYQASRLAWLYMTGDWPPGLLFYADGNPLNTKFSNLTRTRPFSRRAKRSISADYQRQYRYLTRRARRLIQDDSELRDKFMEADDRTQRELLAVARNRVRQLEHIDAVPSRGDLKKAQNYHMGDPL